MSDLISRQAAIMHFVKASKNYECGMLDLKEITHELWQIPAVEPRKGKWIPVTNGRGGHECDQCHEYAPSWQTGEERLTDFCPNCGAMMEDERRKDG